MNAALAVFLAGVAPVCMTTNVKFQQMCDDMCFYSWASKNSAILVVILEILATAMLQRT